MLKLFLKAEVNVIVIPKGRSKCYIIPKVRRSIIIPKGRILLLFLKVNVIIIPKGRSKCYNYS